MRSLLRFALALACAGLSLAGWPADPLPVAAPMPSFSTALRGTLPSVLGVYGFGVKPQAADEAPGSAGKRGQARAPWSTPDEPANIGAGFFIDADGTLVTAVHVVAQAQRVLVKTSDLRVFVAQVIGQDEDTDIALLRVPGLVSVPPVFGRSAASRPGDWVLAIGEPFGLQRSVVAGIVAGRARHFAEDGEGIYIQSDLPLNPGNSGGPLLNATGEVIGMNLRTVVGPLGSAGVSLSTPIEAVLQIAAELRSGHASTRPRLGAGYEDVSPAAALDAERTYASGALVNRVDEASTAQRMGLRRGDIVVALNGQAIEDGADLARGLLAWRSVPGTRMVVWRAGQYLQLIAR